MVPSSFARYNYRSTINSRTRSPYNLPKAPKDLSVAPLSTLHSQTCLSLTLAKFGASKALVIQAYGLCARWLGKSYKTGNWQTRWWLGRCCQPARLPGMVLISDTSLAAGNWECNPLCRLFTCSDILYLRATCKEQEGEFSQHCFYLGLLHVYSSAADRLDLKIELKKIVRQNEHVCKLTWINEVCDLDRALYLLPTQVRKSHTLISVGVRLPWTLLQDLSS